MIDFENPFAFTLLLLIPGVYFLRSIKVFRGISLPLILSDWNGASFKWNKGFRMFISGFIQFLCICGYVCVVTAYANPVVHHQKKVFVSKGTDILFVIDVSPSMAAMDIGGMTRIEAAKNTIRKLSENNEGVELGLVKMAKAAELVVPLTMDRSTFSKNLDEMIVGEMGDGTAIGIGLSCAYYHLSQSTSPKKCIVLITDGENNSGSIHPNTAAHLLKDKGISFYVIGIGTRGSVPVDYVDPKTGQVYSGYLESGYDTNALAQLAQEGDGRFMETDSLASLSMALDSIGNKESVVQSYTVRNFDESYYTHMLLLAAVFLSLAWILRRLYLQELL